MTVESQSGDTTTGPTHRRDHSDRRYRLISIASPIIMIILWELVVTLGLLDRRFFPPPTEVFGVLIELIRSGELLDNLAISLRRILLGFAIGAIPGVILGLLVGWFRGVRAFVDPLVAATYPIPKIALLPLLLVIFGLGEASKVAVVAIAVFFLVLITTTYGVTGIDPVLIEAAQNYGASGRKLGLRVILPAAMPSIFNGLRLGAGIALLVIVAAEFIAANRGIGYMIWISWATLSVGTMYAGLVVISALGILFASGLTWLGKRVMPWAPDIQDRTR
jgi:NitT/TauT family transport system permease protein